MKVPVMKEILIICCVNLFCLTLEFDIKEQIFYITEYIGLNSIIFNQENTVPPKRLMD